MSSARNATFSLRMCRRCHRDMNAREGFRSARCMGARRPGDVDCRICVHVSGAERIHVALISPRPISDVSLARHGDPHGAGRLSRQARVQGDAGADRAIAQAPRRAADLRRPAAPCKPSTLRLPPAGRRDPQELGGAQGAELRSFDQAHGGRGRGPSARLRRLRRRHPERPLRRRSRRRVRLRHMDDGSRCRRAAREGAPALRIARRKTEGRMASGAIRQAGAPAAMVAVQAGRCLGRSR